MYQSRKRQLDSKMYRRIGVYVSACYDTTNNEFDRSGDRAS